MKPMYSLVLFSILLLAMTSSGKQTAPRITTTFADYVWKHFSLAQKSGVLFRAVSEVFDVYSQRSATDDIGEDERAQLNEISKYFQLKHSDKGLYDLQFQFRSLLDMNNGGWKWSWESQEGYEKLYKKGNLVSFIGFYGTGKSFLLNHLLPEEMQIPEGVRVVTKGFSIVYADGIFYIDSEGSKRAVPPNELQDRLITDYFIQELALSVSDIVFFHVSTLQSEDISMLRRLHVRASEINPNMKIFLVHNYWQLTAVEDVEAHIQSDIVGAFGAEKVTKKGKVYYNSDLFAHLILGRQGSASGEKWNEGTFDLAERAIDGQLHNKKVNILDQFKTTMESMLPLVFVHPDVGQGVPHMRSPTQITVEHNEGTGLFKRVVDFVADRALSFVGREVEPTMCSRFSELDPSVWELEVVENFGKSESDDGGDGDGDGDDGGSGDDDDDIPTSMMIRPRIKDNHFRFYDISPTPGSPFPDIQFKAKHDVFVGEDKWVMIMDVVDSSVQVKMNQRTVEILGCRALVDPVVTDGGLTRINGGEDSRQYSTFRYVLPLPEGIDGTNEPYKQLEQATPQNGVLRLEIQL